MFNGRSVKLTANEQGLAKGWLYKVKPGPQPNRITDDEDKNKNSIELRQAGA